MWILRVIAISFLVSPVALSKSTLRKYAGAMYVQNSEDLYDDAYGAFFAAEIDFSKDYLSLGQNLSYYEAQAGEAINDPISPANWIYDIVYSSYGKLRFPSSKSFFSLYGSLGIDTHFAYRQLQNEPDQYKANWSLGWNYGAGLELRVKSIAFEAKVHARRVFGADYVYLNTNEILVGIALISSL